MNVSLVVSTRNRGARLEDFFSALRALEAPDGGWELILVDNGSTDGTAETISRFAATAPFPVRPVHEAMPGLSHARNAGLRHAGGRIVVFTDDDCYPRRHYLRAMVQVFAEHQAGIVGGRVVLHDLADARVGVKDLADGFDIPAMQFVRPGVIHGANMAVRREVLEQIGGFDPLLGAGTPCVAGEDTDFIARAVWAGRTVRYDPRPVVAHHHGRRGADADRQRRGYDRGRGAYYAKWLLDPRARRTYLREWTFTARRMLRKKTPGPLLRELAGAARYLLDRVRSGKAVPSVERATSLPS